MFEHHPFWKDLVRFVESGTGWKPTDDRLAEAMEKAQRVADLEESLQAHVLCLRYAVRRCSSDMYLEIARRIAFAVSLMERVPHLTVIQAVDVLLEGRAYEAMQELVPYIHNDTLRGKVITLGLPRSLQQALKAKEARH